MMKQSLFIGMLLSVISLHAQPLNNVVLFAGNANKELAGQIAQYLDVPLSATLPKKFNDGEISIPSLDRNVRRKDAVIIQSLCSSEHNSINDNIMELFLLVRTMKRSSARSITVVLPYYGYARQDRKVKPRVPISAADIALLLEKAGVDRLITVDLHCGQIQGFFRDTAVDNLYGATVFTPYVARKKDLANVVVVSPDAGGVERATQFMHNLEQYGIDASMSVISKQRAAAGVIGSMHLIGDVTDADAIIVDDMCDTGGTLIKAAELLKEHGARRVFAVITHPVFSNNALEKLGNPAIDEMIISNSIPLKGQKPANITQISVAPLLGEAIKRIVTGESVSALFDVKNTHFLMS